MLCIDQKKNLDLDHYAQRYINAGKFHIDFYHLLYTFMKQIKMF